MSNHEATINETLRKHRDNEEVYKDLSAVIVATAHTTADACASAAKEVLADKADAYEAVIATQQTVIYALKALSL
jgi:hypothetical protein